MAKVHLLKRYLTGFLLQFFLLQSIPFSSFHGFRNELYDFVFIIIILLIWKFFTPALADGFSQESEWQQVSSSLEDSSLYSDPSQ